MSGHRERARWGALPSAATLGGTADDTEDDTEDRMQDGREDHTERHEVLIVGGGNAGISLAARLLRDGARDVAVVESESVHRYRPLLNYVGAGEATMSSLERPAVAVDA